MTARQETIAAIATAPGRGSVGIIRVSGPLAKDIANKISTHTLKPRYAHFGDFLNPTSGDALDQGLMIFFPSPHSFTGEDVLELQGHGGPVILDILLKSITSFKGVRLAKPGEFSERAFLNDKMDLTQVEAIADLIDASSEQAARNAMHSLQGVFSQKIHNLVDQVTQLRVYIEAAIDFPEEEIDFLNDRGIVDRIEQLTSNFETTLNQAKQGLIIKEGMTVVIAGKPNAGKSSLLNQLAGRESAIVTDIAGTTRDLLREHIHLDGIPLYIIDTAGLRESGDQVERIGIERAWSEITKADLILLLVDIRDAANHAQSGASSILSSLVPALDNNQAHSLDPAKVTIVYNKCDLVEIDNCLLPDIQEFKQLAISAKQGTGIDELKSHLKNSIGFEQVNEGGFTARRRHLQALNQAWEHLNRAHEQLKCGSGELVAEELRLSQQSLSEITGKLTADDLLGKIFSSFCIGK
jgi:tRNA modification GTPase